MSSEPLSMFWMLSPNVGDALAPWLVEKVTGHRPVYAAADANYEHLIVGGSVLNWANEHTRAWGAGIASLSDQIHPLATIHAYRGPLSRLRAHTCGVKRPVDIYGDPALLLPKWLPTAPTKTHKIGVAPHYIDMFAARRLFGHAGPDLLLIDMLGTVEEVVHQITSCEQVLSSALHGIIIADAYGVPNAWCKITDLVGGDGTKFWDHYAAVRRTNLDEPPRFLDLRSEAMKDRRPPHVGELEAMTKKLMGTGDLTTHDIAGRLWNSRPLP